MKTRLPIVIAAVLLFPGCEKQEESKPAPVVQPAAAEKKTRPIPVPGPPAPAAPGTPAAADPAVQTEAPAPEEVQAFLTDLDKLGKEVAQLDPNAAPSPDVETMQKTFTALIQRRGALMTRMTPEQKKKLMQDMPPSARTISPTLMRLRLAKAREKMKNAVPPQPGTPPADPAPGDLIPRENPPPAPPQ